MARKKIDLDKVSSGNKEILFDILEKNAVDVVTVTFDGGGDDGSLEPSDLPEKVANILVEGSKVCQGTTWKDGKSRKNWKHDCTVEEVIEGICYEVLEILYEGWENNDGAFGDFTFDVKKRKILFDFNERYVESKLYEHVL